MFISRKVIDLNNSSDSYNTFLIQKVLPQIPEEAFEEIGNFKEIMMMYHSAVRQVTTKLEILNDEFSLDSPNNPIQVVKSRIKKPMSILQKLQKLEKEISLESVMKNLNDVAGIRVICSFIDDVYRTVEMIRQQDDIVLIEAKDYIKNPKPNGYRSFHLIIEVPIYFSKGKQFVRVEIQIRTVAMDFWASLEHKLKYKNNLENTKAIEEELRMCAESIANTDLKMMKIRDQIEGK